MLPEICLLLIPNYEYNPHAATTCEMEMESAKTVATVVSQLGGQSINAIVDESAWVAA